LLNRSLRRHAPTNLIPPCQYPFFFTEPAPPELYTLSLHDALPISVRPGQAHLLVPPAAENADGAGPDGDPSARAHHDEPAGHRLPRSDLRRDDGGAEIAAALRLPDEEPADLPAVGARFRGHGVLLREHGDAGGQGDRLPERRLRRPHARERGALRRIARRGRGQVGRAGRPAEA